MIPGHMSRVRCIPLGPILSYMGGNSGLAVINLYRSSPNSGPYTLSKVLVGNRVMVGVDLDVIIRSYLAFLNCSTTIQITVDDKTFYGSRNPKFNHGGAHFIEAEQRAATPQ